MNVGGSGHGISGLVIRRSTIPWRDAQSSAAVEKTADQDHAVQVRLTGERASHRLIEQRSTFVDVTAADERSTQLARGAQRKVCVSSRPRNREGASRVRLGLLRLVGIVGDIGTAEEHPPTHPLISSRPNSSTYTAARSSQPRAAASFPKLIR